MAETERLHLIEWIVLIDEIHLNALMQLSDEELEKRYMLSMKKVSGEIKDDY
ncbi:BH0509 family protein [Bacillus thuringiensis]|uniref:BH0509 family protein n=1 Tax=Bacillus thuringiensis TaxID=1428 RepID=UPI001155BDA8|nr:BH0509 family protein [Bacillus thuringiensis]